MALQAASVHLEVAAGYASGRIWAEDAGHPVRHAWWTTCATCGRIEISDLQNREGQHPLSAGPRAGYRRDWLVVWRLESARAHRGLTELGNADLTDTQIRALRGAISASRRSEKLCPFSATFCRPPAAIAGLNSVLFSDSSRSRERT